MRELDCRVCCGDEAVEIVLDGRPVARGDAATCERAILEMMAARAAMRPRRLPVLFEGSAVILGDGWTWMPGHGSLAVAVHHPGIGWIGAPRGARLG